MRLYRLTKFMTLVLILGLQGPAAGAAPTSELKPKSAKQQLKKIESTPAPAEQKVEMETVSPTAAGNPPSTLGNDPLLPTRSLAKEAWTAGGGLWLGALDENNSSATSFFVSLMKTNYNLNETAQEFGAVLTDKSRVGAHWGFKWLKGFAQDQEWFYKVGVAALYLPSENIGTLINYRRYYAFGSVGFENLFRWNRHIRADITGMVGPVGLSLQLNLGYAFEDWIF